MRSVPVVSIRAAIGSLSFLVALAFSVVDKRTLAKLDLTEKAAKKIDGSMSPEDLAGVFASARRVLSGEPLTRTP